MKIISSLSAICLLGLSGPLLSAAVIFDSNGFESPSYTVGALAGQNGWTATPIAGNASVVTVGGGQAVSIPGGSASRYFSQALSYTPDSNIQVVVSADISRTLGTSSSSFYGLDFYNESGGTRIGRVGLFNVAGEIKVAVESKFTLAGDPVVATPDPAGSTTFAYYGNALANDQVVQFDVTFDFAAQTFSLTSDWVDFSGLNFPFLAASTALSSADLHMLRGGPGGTVRDDSGTFDNYVVSTIVVPEPSSYAGLAGAAGLAYVAAVRRRRRC